MPLGISSERRIRQKNKGNGSHWRDQFLKVGNQCLQWELLPPLYTPRVTWKKPSIHWVCPWGHVSSQGVVTGSSTPPSRPTPSEARG
jgi:hypothetical protein